MNAEKVARTQQYIEQNNHRQSWNPITETSRHPGAGGREKGTASTNIAERWNNAEKIEGIEDTITLANGEKIPGRYVLASAEAMSPSHDIGRNFAKTEGFPVNGQGKTVNDRDYEADKQAQILVQQRANNFDERAVQTPVVVSNDRIVLSGNDRTMSGQMAAQQGTDLAYTD